MVNLSVPSTVMDRGPQRMVHFMDFKVTRTEQSSWTAVGACQWSRALGRAAPDNGDLVPLYVPFCGHRDLIQKLRTFSILPVFSSLSFAAMSTVISDSFLQSFFCPSGRSWKKSGAPRTDLRLAPINGSFFFRDCGASLAPIRALFDEFHFSSFSLVLLIVSCIFFFTVQALGWAFRLPPGRLPGAFCVSWACPCRF